MLAARGKRNSHQLTHLLIFQAEWASDMSIRTETVDNRATEFLVFPNADPNKL
jgi:hypothetical protein